MARFIKNRTPSKGRSPGSIVFIGKKKTEIPSIREFMYNSETFTELEHLTIQDVKLSPDIINWVNIDGLHDTALIDEVGKKFGINPMYLEDIANTDQRPKFEEDENHIFVVMKFIGYNEHENRLHTDQVSFILGNNYLLSFQERKGDYFEPVRERIRNGKGRIRTMKTDYLLYALMDAVSDIYLDTIERIGERIEELDNEIFHHPDTSLIKRIYSYKTELNYVRKSVRPLKEITFAILRCESAFFSKKTRSFYRDLDDLVTQSVETLETYYTMNSDQLNILNTLIGNKTNDVMKTLTIFASIFIPLTFIAGVYGTNFDYLPELHFKYSYFIMWGIILVITAFMLRFFKRKKWF
jgi:magnesium transporter